MSRAACTIAQAIRCVNESFLPPALSAFRRASSASTGTLRKLVAVGIDRLSFMNFTSVAAGPRIGSVVAPSAGLAGADPPLPSTAASTSSLVTRPRGPEPVIASTSRPWALAMRAATGVALPPFVAGASAAGFTSVASALGWTAPFPPPVPPAMRHSTEPTGTVWSASTRISAIVPATGDGTSASTLSVEISTSGSSTATESPALTRHSRIVPSATESPISGKVTSTSSPSGSSGAAGADPLPSSGSISPSTDPT